MVFMPPVERLFGGFSGLGARAGGGSSGFAPVNIIRPSIVGTPTDGLNYAFNLGSYLESIPVTKFEIEVVTTDETPIVVLARQEVTAVAGGSTPGAVGKLLKLRVWAFNGDAFVLTESLPFGPIVAAGDLFILAVAFGTSTRALPSTPHPFVGIIGPNIGASDVRLLGSGDIISAGTTEYPIANHNIPYLDFGSSGTLGGNLVNQSSPNVLMKGRLLSSLGASQRTISEVGIPDSATDDTYKLYAGMFAHGVVADGNLGVWVNSVSPANSIYQMGPTSQGGSDSRALDATGVAATQAVWEAVDAVGMGNPQIITVPAGTGRKLIFARSGNPGSASPNVCCLALFKEA